MQPAAPPREPSPSDELLGAAAKETLRLVGLYDQGRAEAVQKVHAARQLHAPSSQAISSGLTHLEMLISHCE